MNRVDLRTLSGIRLNEAQALLNQSCYPGAYYLAGYSVECALKACVAKQIREHDFPEKKLVLDSYTHDLERLLGIAGIKKLHEDEIRNNAAFDLNWNVVKDWSEESRYQTQTSEQAAKDMMSALIDPKNGVLVWLKKHW